MHQQATFHSHAPMRPLPARLTVLLVVAIRRRHFLVNCDPTHSDHSSRRQPTLTTFLPNLAHANAMIFAFGYPLSYSSLGDTVAVSRMAQQAKLISAAATEDHMVRAGFTT